MCSVSEASEDEIEDDTKSKHRSKSKRYVLFNQLMHSCLHVYSHAHVSEEEYEEVQVVVKKPGKEKRYVLFHSLTIMFLNTLQCASRV